MKALEYLKKEREIKKHCADVAWGYYDKSIDEAIKELEDLQNENKSLVKILEKMNEKMIDLRKENQDLKSRSCATCKYGRSFHFDKDIECMKLYDATQGLCFEKDFYCKNWESK